MTRPKGNVTAVGLVNGSMAVAKKAAKVKNVLRTRTFLASKSSMNESFQVLTGSQSCYPVGTQFTDETFLFSAVQLSQNAQAWIKSHDCYRISLVEVFATMNVASLGNGPNEQTTPVEVYFYEDTDADPATQTSWIRVQDRDNLGRVVLTKANPSMRLITFKPTITFAAGGAGQDPANMIASKNQWLDALSLDQLYSGLRIFTCCGQKDQTGRTYSYHVGYTVRYTIEARQPL